jgi:hypothetical protein
LATWKASKAHHPFEQPDIRFNPAETLAHIAKALAHIEAQPGRLALVVGDLLGGVARLVVATLAARNVSCSRPSISPM